MIKLAIYFLACQGVGVLGGAATARGVRDWFPTLRKPWWNPPARVFAPVWVTLYTLMAIAGWRVSLDGPATILFGLQLLLNGLWSPLFFGLRRPDLALLDILAMWCAIALCLSYFQDLDPTAAWLFLPYWLWVSFAALLNFEIWRLNRISYEG